MRIYLIAFALVATSLTIFAYTRSGPFEDQTSFDRDVEYVAEIHLRNQNIPTQRLALERQIARNVGSALDKFDARIIDQDAFQSLLFDGLGEWLEKKILLQIKTSYTRHLDQQEIEALANYYRSDAGQMFLKLACSVDEPAAELLDTFYKGPGRMLAEHAQDFTKDITQHSAAMTGEIAEFLSMRRVAEIAQRPDVVAFDGRYNRSDVVAAMRAAYEAQQ